MLASFIPSILPDVAGTFLNDQPDTDIYTVSLGPDADFGLFSSIQAQTGDLTIDVEVDPEDSPVMSSLPQFNFTSSAYALASVNLDLPNRLADAYRALGEQAVESRPWIASVSGSYLALLSAAATAWMLNFPQLILKPLW